MCFKHRNLENSQTSKTSIFQLLRFLFGKYIIVQKQTQISSSTAPSLCAGLNYALLWTFGSASRVRRLGRFCRLTGITWQLTGFTPIWGFRRRLKSASVDSASLPGQRGKRRQCKDMTGSSGEAVLQVQARGPAPSISEKDVPRNWKMLERRLLAVA